MALRPRDKREHDWSVNCVLAGSSQVFLRRHWVTPALLVLEELRQPISLVLREFDKSPGNKATVVRRPQGCIEHDSEFFRTRTRSTQALRRNGPAREHRGQQLVLIHVGSKRASCLIRTCSSSHCL